MSNTPELRKGFVTARMFSRLNRSFLKTRFHDIMFRNEFMLMRLWGLRAPERFSSSPYGNTYGDLTTLLMRRTLRRLIHARGLSRVHEIGIGHYGLMCLYLRKQFPALTISGSTISALEVTHATETATLNGCKSNYYLSDVLASIAAPVEMVWWNLPYYEPGVLDFLGRLRDQVRSGRALLPGGFVVLGFNGVPLNAEAVRAVFDADDFSILQTETFAWNPHVVFTIQHVIR